MKEMHQDGSLEELLVRENIIKKWMKSYVKVFLTNDTYLIYLITK